MLTLTKANISQNESKLETPVRQGQEEEEQVALIRPSSQVALLAPLQTSGESTFGHPKVPSIHESYVDDEADHKSPVSSNSTSSVPEPKEKAPLVPSLFAKHAHFQ